MSPLTHQGPKAWDLDPATAEVIAEAVGGCPGVARLSAGVGVEVATYLAGRRVLGVRLRDAIEVHVVARYGVTVQSVAGEVRAAVAAATAPDLVVDVYVDDVELEGQSEVPSGEGTSDARLPASTR